MKQSNMKKENAVSPVVGVMLMLVVTIVVAAVVATFVGGIGTNEQQAPSAKFDVSYTVQISDTDKTNQDPNYPSSHSKNNGLTFRLISGDTVDLSKIKVTLTSAGQSIAIPFDLARSKDAAVSDVDDSIINNFNANADGEKNYYAVNYGLDDKIKSGESFTLLADGYYDNTDSDATKKGQFLLWKPTDDSRFTVQTYTSVTYTILDTVSNKQIQTGTVTIK